MPGHVLYNSQTRTTFDYVKRKTKAKKVIDKRLGLRVMETQKSKWFDDFPK